MEKKAMRLRAWHLLLRLMLQVLHVFQRSSFKRRNQKGYLKSKLTVVMNLRSRSKLILPKKIYSQTISPSCKSSIDRNWISHYSLRDLRGMWFQNSKVEVWQAASRNQWEALKKAISQLQKQLWNSKCSLQGALLSRDSWRLSRNPLRYRRMWRKRNLEDLREQNWTTNVSLHSRRRVSFQSMMKMLDFSSKDPVIMQWSRSEEEITTKEKAAF